MEFLADCMLDDLDAWDYMSDVQSLFPRVRMARE